MCQKMKKKGWSIGNDMKLARRAGEGREGGVLFVSNLFIFFCVICDMTRLLKPSTHLSARNVILHA